MAAAAGEGRAHTRRLLVPRSLGPVRDFAGRFLVPALAADQHVRVDGRPAFVGRGQLEGEPGFEFLLDPLNPEARLRVQKIESRRKFYDRRALFNPALRGRNFGPARGRSRRI